jgi:hypothetical protein
MDVGRPMPVRGLNDELYFNMCRCKYLGHRVIYFMKSKDEIVDTVRQYQVETRAIDVRVAHIEYTVKLIVTDSDKLYMSRAFQTLAQQHNIRQWFAAPYTHAQAAGIETDMRVIGEGAIIAIHSSGFPLQEAARSGPYRRTRLGPGGGMARRAFDFFYTRSLRGFLDYTR